MQKAPSEDSDLTANAQDDLNLRLAHLSEGTFSVVAAQICGILGEKNTQRWNDVVSMLKLCCVNVVCLLG